MAISSARSIRSAASSNLLEEHYLQERRVGDYAARLAMTADHLNELVKKRQGRTASRLIQDRLHLEAKRLLLHADLSVKEVGYALNMKDPRTSRAGSGRWRALRRQRIGIESGDRTRLDGVCPLVWVMITAELCPQQNTRS